MASPPLRAWPGVSARRWPRPASSSWACRRWRRSQRSASSSKSRGSQLPPSMRASASSAGCSPASAATEGWSCQSVRWARYSTCPERRQRPCEGASSPARMRASRDLPTPLRPTRPVRRWSRVSERSEKRGLPSGSTQETPSSVIVVLVISRFMDANAVPCRFACIARAVGRVGKSGPLGQRQHQWRMGRIPPAMVNEAAIIEIMGRTCWPCRRGRHRRRRRQGGRHAHRRLHAAARVRWARPAARGLQAPMARKGSKTVPAGGPESTGR